MKNLNFLKPAALALLIPVFATSSCAPQHAVAAAPVSAADNSASNALFNEVNAYRTSKGLTALKRNPGLDRLAQGHSEFMRKNRGHFKLEGKNVSHDGFEARSVIAREKYQTPGIQENVAAGPRGTSIFQAWRSSSIHDKVMRAQWSSTGVGVVVDGDGHIFATQIYGNPVVSSLLLQNRFGGF
jgi:uncharacterized protein YkwD